MFPRGSVAGVVLLTLTMYNSVSLSRDPVRIGFPPSSTVGPVGSNTVALSPRNRTPRLPAQNLRTDKSGVVISLKRWASLEIVGNSGIFSISLLRLWTMDKELVIRRPYEHIL